MNVMFDNFLLGMQTAFTPENIMYSFFGVFLGTMVGIIPGIGALTTIALLFPMTFYLEPASALIMLGGIWYGTNYGGSATSILLNIPGGAANAVTCLDGYPMTKQGRGGIALFMTTVVSFVGASSGILLMMFFAPTVASFALTLNSAEYFSLMVLGLVSASTISDGSPLKGLAMVLVGIALGSVGLDIYTGSPRFSFGLLDLYEGISLVALAMGLFGVSEIIASIRTAQTNKIDRESVSFRNMRPTRDDVRRSVGPTLRGSGVGAFFGVLPGVGTSIASFISYAIEKRVARDPSRFGHGAIEGVVSPEAANNAADQTAFIPTMALGIPGSATMALMLGALIIQGVSPGPQLMTEHPDIFWGLVMSFWIGNILLVILNIPLIGLWVRLLLIPYPILYPTILMFICVGAFTFGNNIFDVWMVLLFGIVGYLLKVLDFSPAPLLLGFVLGPLMEENFRRAMLISRGDMLIFVERPISGAIIVLTAIVLIWSFRTSIVSRKRRNMKLLEQ